VAVLRAHVRPHPFAAREGVLPVSEGLSSRRRLGRSGLWVSPIALGTMTFGEQNDEREAFAILDCAVDHGVNLIDTAELYPIPPRAETYGETERIIGRWLARSKKRDKVLIATKVCGPTDWCPHIRNGKARLDAKNIVQACEASLKRLGVDCIDLYQTHWPERKTNYFGRLGYRPQPEEETTPIEETLEALDRLVQAGKVRAVGVSNETPWGVMRHLFAAETKGLVRIASIQNPYNLLNRTFEIGLAEIAHREEVPLLAYSPLGFGVLTGKYLDGARPPRARLTRFPQYTRYSSPEAEAATKAYVELARKAGIAPAQMAIAFIMQQPFVASVIIGATSLAQLQENLAAAELRLSDDVLREIEAIHKRHPNPAP